MSALTFFGSISTSMTGTIPTELAAASNLELLLFQDSAFTGTIPTEIGLATKITRFYARGVSFSGSLPTEIGELNKMYTLAIADATTDCSSSDDDDDDDDDDWFDDDDDGGDDEYSCSSDCELSCDGFSDDTTFADDGLADCLTDCTDDAIASLCSSIESNCYSYSYSALYDSMSCGSYSSACTYEIAAAPITGSLPTQLGRLSTNLRALKVAESSICGDIPDEVSDLSLGSSFSYSGSCVGTPCGSCTSIPSPSTPSSPSSTPGPTLRPSPRPSPAPTTALPTPAPTTALPTPAPTALPTYAPYTLVEASSSVAMTGFSSPKDFQEEHKLAFKNSLVATNDYITDTSQVTRVNATAQGSRRRALSSTISVDFSIALTLEDYNVSNTTASSAVSLVSSLVQDLVAALNATGNTSFISTFVSVAENVSVAGISVDVESSTSSLQTMTATVAITSVAYTRPPTEMPTPLPIPTPTTLPIPVPTLVPVPAPTTPAPSSGGKQGDDAKPPIGAIVGGIIGGAVFLGGAAFLASKQMGTAKVTQKDHEMGVRGATSYSAS